MKYIVRGLESRANGEAAGLSMRRIFVADRNDKPFRGNVSVGPDSFQLTMIRS
jgi:hypothetical protein